LNELYELHEQGVTQPSKCREFSHRASLFLDRLEGLGAYEVADRMMELLGGCSPKDFSPCDNRVVYRTTCEKIHSLSLAQCSGVHSSIQPAQGSKKSSASKGLKRLRSALSI